MLYDWFIKLSTNYMNTLISQKKKKKKPLSMASQIPILNKLAAHWIFSLLKSNYKCLYIYLSLPIFRRTVKKIKRIASIFPSFSRICLHSNTREPFPFKNTPFLLQIHRRTLCFHFANLTFIRHAFSKT